MQDVLVKMSSLNTIILRKSKIDLKVRVVGHYHSVVID